MKLKLPFKLFKKRSNELETPDITQIALDDIGQIELILDSNNEFVKKEIRELIEIRRHNFGLDKDKTRKTLPYPMTHKKLDTNTLSKNLIDHGFQECKKIQIGNSSVIASEKSKYNVFKSKSMDVFFSEENKYVEMIWVDFRLIGSVREFNKLENLLFYFGESLNLLLVDWKNLELVNLKNRRRTKNYLLMMF